MMGYNASQMKRTVYKVYNEYLCKYLSAINESSSSWNIYGIEFNSAELALMVLEFIKKRDGETELRVICETIISKEVR